MFKVTILAAFLAATTFLPLTASSSTTRPAQATTNVAETWSTLPSTSSSLAMDHDPAIFNRRVASPVEPARHPFRMDLGAAEATGTTALAKRAPFIQGIANLFKAIVKGVSKAVQKSKANKQKKQKEKEEKEAAERKRKEDDDRRRREDEEREDARKRKEEEDRQKEEERRKEIEEQIKKAEEEARKKKEKEERERKEREERERKDKQQKERDEAEIQRLRDEDPNPDEKKPKKGGAKEKSTEGDKDEEESEPVKGSASSAGLASNWKLVSGVAALVNGVVLFFF